MLGLALEDENLGLGEVFPGDDCAVRLQHHGSQFRPVVGREVATHAHGNPGKLVGEEVPDLIRVDVFEALDVFVCCGIVEWDRQGNHGVAEDVFRLLGHAVAARGLVRFRLRLLPVRLHVRHGRFGVVAVSEPRSREVVDHPDVLG